MNHLFLPYLWAHLCILPDWICLAWFGLPTDQRLLWASQVSGWTRWWEARMVSSKGLVWLCLIWFDLVWFGRPKSSLTRDSFGRLVHPLTQGGGKPEWYALVVWFDLVEPSHRPETPWVPYRPPADPRRPKESRVTGRMRWWEVWVVRIGGTQAPALCLNQLLVVTQAGVATHHRRRLTHLWERTESSGEWGGGAPNPSLLRTGSDPCSRSDPYSGPDPILAPDWIGSLLLKRIRSLLWKSLLWIGSLLWKGSLLWIRS